MASSLSVYLHDHMAGSNFAVALLESLQARFSGESLGPFAAEILEMVLHDRTVLQSIIERVGESSADLKDAAAWMTEKISRLKLARDSGDLGTFEALELLELGIFGKLSLWRALERVAEIDSRVRGADYPRLTASAQVQLDRVEAIRLEIALKVFDPAPQ